MQRTTLKVLPYGAFFPFSWHRADLCCDYYFHDGGRGLANQDWTSLLGGHGLQHAPYNIQHAADHACYVLRHYFCDEGVAVTLASQDCEHR
jgi:hypothetical protein